MITMVAETAVEVPIWSFMVLLAIPAAVVGLGALFTNNKRFVRSQFDVRMNEMWVAGHLPTRQGQEDLQTSQDKLRDSMDDGMRRITVMELQIRNGISEQLAELKAKQTVISGKVDQLIGHLDA